MQPHHSRKRLTVGVAAIAVGALALLSGCAGSPGSGNPTNGGDDAAGGDLVIATYGGPTGDAFQEVYFDAYTELTGGQITQVPADVARYVSMSEAGDSEWDSIDADGFAVVDWVDKGIVQELSPDVPRADMVDEKFANYSAGGYTQSFLIAYRVSAFDEAPQSWADFWDTEKFPGKRGWPGYYIGTAEAALMADGVAPDDLYPLDFDRAFTKLDELRPDLTIIDSYAGLSQGLQAGSFDMALVPNGRGLDLMKESDDFAMQWNQNIFYPWTGWTISAGAPNAAGMNTLLTIMNDPEKQAEFAERTGYGPTQSAAYDLLSPEAAANLPGTEEHTAVAAPVDTEVLAGQTDEYIERYSQWLAQ